MAKLTLHGLLSGYESTKDGHGQKSFFVRNMSGSLKSSQWLIRSRPERFFKRLSLIISYTTARAFGLFLLGFGLLSIILHFVKDYLGVYEEVPLNVLVIGAVFSILAVPLLAVDKPVAIASQEYLLADYIVHEFFCIKRMHKDDGMRGVSPALMLLFGLLLAVLGAFVPLVYVAGSLMGLLYAYLTFLSPEFSFFSTFLLMPYISVIDSNKLILCAIVTLNVISFGRKVLHGKRVYAFEQYDLALFVMLLFILISGIFVKGIESFESSVVMILLAMGYFLAGNLLTNRRLVDCAIHAVIISSLPVSVIAVVQYVRGAVTSGSIFASGVSATFADASVLAVFLLVALGFSVYFAIGSRTAAARALYFVILSLTLAALFATQQAWAVVAASFGALAFPAARQRRGSGVTLGLLSVSLYALLFLPVGAVSFLGSLWFLKSFDISGFFDKLGVSFAMLRDNIFTGIGIGKECFSEEYDKYVPGAYAKNSSSFLLEIGLEAGIFALAIFLVIMLIRLVHTGRYRRYIRRSEIKGASYACSAILVSLTVFGVCNYIWTDLSMYYIFWCVFGIGSAALRISKRENDDRVGYFKDGSSVSASSININIR